LWNNLPEKLKLTENTTTFKKLLRLYIVECVDELAVDLHLIAFYTVIVN